MLNEMIGNRYECPVCGRYHNGPMDQWWCDYCGPSLTTLALTQLDNLAQRMTIIEERVDQNLPIQSIPLNNIEELFNH